MSYRLKIDRYSSKTGDTTPLDFDIPARVTITGKEDHWGRAVEDARLIIQGMQGLDLILGDDTTRYHVKSLESW